MGDGVYTTRIGYTADAGSILTGFPPTTVSTIIRKPFDSIMKSILVAVFNLKAEEVVVIGHHNCGMSNVDTEALKKTMINRGIDEEKINTLTHSGISLDEEFHGFETVEESVMQSVGIIRNHPLLPKEVKVHGLVINPDTGKVDVVTKE